MVISRKNRKILFFLLIFVILISGCPRPEQIKFETREDATHDAIKGNPETDNFPPVIHLNEWSDPVPMDGPINTAGAEDSPFITPNGQKFFFVFVSDVHLPPEKQLIDGVSGIWLSKKIGGIWEEPERIILNNNLSLDGCPFFQGDLLWFCSVRSGNFGEVDVYTAGLNDGNFGNWQNAGEQLNKEYKIGEFHITADGKTIYFGREHEGGFGGRDIWKSDKINGGWSEPVNLGPNVNSELNEDQPFISSDEKELWFTGQSRRGYTGPAVYRSLKSEDGQWGKAEEVISNFAGEPTLDDEGNIYFVHHYFTKDIKMIEADIYVANRK